MKAQNMLPESDMKMTRYKLSHNVKHNNCVLIFNYTIWITDYDAQNRSFIG